MAYKGEEGDKSRSKLLAILGLYPHLLALRSRVDLHCTGLLHKRSHVLLPGNDVIDLQMVKKMQEEDRRCMFQSLESHATELGCTRCFGWSLSCHAKHRHDSQYRTHVPKACACYMSVTHRNQHRLNATGRQRCARSTTPHSFI